jgi:hypothetical protein
LRKLTQEDLSNLDNFKNDMIKKLNTKKNRKKLHWSVMPCLDLLFLLEEEFYELAIEFINSNKLDKEAIKQECLDIANFAFMIYDNIDKENYEK